MNNKLLISTFLLATLLFSGCIQLSDAEIQEKLITANFGLNSYSVNIILKMNSSYQMLGKNTMVISEMSSTGDIDRINKKMNINNIIKSEALGMKNEMNMDMIVFDNRFYTKVLGSWVKMELDNDIWKQQDQIAQIIDLIKSGRVQRLSDDSFNGNSYYIIKVFPDLNTVAEFALKNQQQNSLIKSEKNMDFADMIKSYSLTLWVNKKTFIIDKSFADMKIVLTPENLEVKGANGFNQETHMTAEIKMSNLNKEFDIVLPKDAITASDISFLKKTLPSTNDASSDEEDAIAVNYG